MNFDINTTLLGEALNEHAIVSATDAAGNIIYVNQKFCDISGYTSEELLGKNHRIIKSSMHPATFYQSMWNTLLDGQTWQGEICNRRKDGELYWVRATIKPILDNNGLPVKFVSIRTDITEIKQAEKQLSGMNAELELYKQHSEYELELARELIEHMIRQSSTPIGNAEIWLQAATNLSGDMILTRSYGNDLSYLLLADAMGHGLPAALPLIPIVQIFSSMAPKGSSISALVTKMNQRICDLIPVGNFVALTLVSINHANRSIEIWNGGNPHALLHNNNGEIIRKFASRHPALGISRNDGFDPSTELYIWNEECRLTLHSDGLVDARNTQEEHFGEEQVLASLRSSEPHQSLKSAVLRHLGKNGAHDDISIATVRLERTN